jgi:hypothetical protein
MRREWLLAVALLAAALVTGAASADSGQPAASGSPQSPSAPGQKDLPLALSIGALSLGKPSFTEVGSSERVRASTGAGTSRWPSSRTEIGRGVYLSVSPSCIPGVDEPLWPGTQRPGARRR